MQCVTLFLQLIVAFGLLNVWILRRNQETPYRGSDGKSLKEEFAAYGLPAWAFYAVGLIKISAALLLILGLWLPYLVFPAAAVVSLLMMGAIAMHLKVKDPYMKSMPAFIMLVCSIGICMDSLQWYL
ncbi:DoxX family protein [Estrella lausannensis]|uniref:Conserved putative membrane protein n=1 Tax=Estrella lausannensis TaxID=483423 RepID=A0A0H5DQS0_9BACT|nr:DoxX family protein [Estrella lausannensis]CRX37944.1 Conserved putative membrane protein [Estrella lausannensis]